MQSRKILILFLSIMCVSIFFSSNAYSHWYEERIHAFLNEIQDEVDNMTVEKRKLIRWGPSYESITIMKGILEKNNVKDPLILIPPASYGFKFMRGLTIVEPVIFYYYTGLKATTRDCKDMRKATYCIVADKNGQPQLVNLKDSTAFTNTLLEYQSTPPQ